MRSERFNRAAAELGRGVLLPYYKYKFSQFRKTLDSAPERQQRFILDLVQRSAATEFGRAHGFSSVRTIDDFRNAVPIGDYETVRPFIEREAQGVRNAIIPASDTIKAFACTTGTTGKSKILPVTARWLQPYQSNWRMWGAKCIADHDNIIGTNWLQISGSLNVSTTASGKQIGMVSAISARYQSPIFNIFHAVPASIGDVAVPDTKYYAILRLAMAQNCGFLISITAANFLKLARMGDALKETLIRDIHDGTFENLDKVQAHLSDKAVAFAKRPNPARAKKLEQLAARFGALYPKHYWDVCLVCCWLGGTVGYQSKELVEYYGDTAYRDIGYVSTEGRHTIPISDDGADGPLIADGAFYEFKPLDSDRTVLAHELEQGQSYEVIMSSANGLFRYAIADIVRCQSFLARTPVLEFLRKTSDVSDLEGEKISAEHVILAVKGAFAHFNKPVVGRFSLAPIRPENGTPYYGVVTEESLMRATGIDASFADQIDAQLKSLNMAYYQRRAEGFLAAPVLMKIPAGSWDRLSDEVGRARGTGETQFKHPAFIDTATLDDLANHRQSSAA